MVDNNINNKIFMLLNVPSCLVYLVTTLVMGLPFLLRLRIASHY
jgi:hypothetical protein